MKKKHIIHCLILVSAMLLVACKKESEREKEVRENYESLTKEEASKVAYAIEEGLSGHYEIIYGERLSDILFGACGWAFS